MTMTKTAGMLGLSVMLIGCSLPIKSPSSSELTQAGRYQEAAALNLADARRSEQQQFWSSAVSYYVMAADNYRRATCPSANSRLCWTINVQRCRPGSRQRAAWTATLGKVAQSAGSRGVWLERDKDKAVEYYRALLARQDDVRMLYRGPGLELVKAASRSEALHSPNLTMRLYLFGLSGLYVEDGDLYPQLAIDFARQHGYADEAGQLRKRLVRVKQLEPALESQSDDPHEQMRIATARGDRYEQLGEVTLAAAEPVNACIQIASGGPNTITTAATT